LNENDAESKVEYHSKVLLLGDSAVGKTSLLRKFIYGKFSSDYRASLGVDFLQKVIQTESGATLSLAIWDVAGETKFSAFKSIYYTGASGVLLLFDLTRKETFDNLSFWYKDLSKICPDAAIVIIANKSDLTNQRKVENSDIEAIKTELNSEVILTSAKTGRNIDDAFLTLAEKMLENL